MNPQFPVPPPDLAFDAYNHLDWQAYHDSGRQHAEAFAHIIRQNVQVGGQLRILEWGCGPGRIIRQMAHLLQDYTPLLAGSDYNRRTIAWCCANLPGIEFFSNELMPPLPVADAEFDVTYNFSVFTHLSEAVQVAWARELWRVLKPGGLLVCSTHGDNYRYLLTSAEEKARYDAGEVVVQARYGEGRKWFFAIHPGRFVRQTLLTDFEHVRMVPALPAWGMLQDIWIARKPAA